MRSATALELTVITCGFPGTTRRIGSYWPALARWATNMDFLLALVSPALFPVLERVLEVAFLTGFAHSWKLQATQKGQPNKALPSLARRKRPARRLTVCSPFLKLRLTLEESTTILHMQPRKGA